MVNHARSEPDTGIEGRIAIGPNPPKMNREAASDPVPLRKAPFVVADEKGVAASFATDDGGRFRVFLAAGRYTISQKDNETKIRRCGPWDVDVVAGKMTSVEWYCDAGGARLDAYDRAKKSPQVSPYYLKTK